MRLKVHEDKCIGAGLCVQTDDELFSQRDEDGVSVALVGEPSGTKLEAARTAVDLCPARAIELTQ
jgi:ferredoxin